MKSFVAILALVAVAAAADVPYSRSADAAAQILRQDAEVLPNGYSYAYETSNGIQGQESGDVKNAGREDESIVVQGSNAYTNDQGERISLTYVADANGFQPQGSHLPTPQPIPDYIIRALEYIRLNAPKIDPTRRI